MSEDIETLKFDLSLWKGKAEYAEQKVRELEKENEELKQRLESTCEQRLVYEQDAEKYHDEAVKYKKVIKLLTEHVKHKYNVELMVINKYNVPSFVIEKGGNSKFDNIIADIFGGEVNDE